MGVKRTRAVIDMVGDLAAYNPSAKVVIFEGEDSDFDLRMTSELFPDLLAQVNAVSGTNKPRVRGLHRLLETLSQGDRLPPMRVFSITDKDSDKATNNAVGSTQFSWDVYHIENYLLVPQFIVSALTDLLGSRDVPSEKEVDKELVECARETLVSLVVHDTCDAANREMIAAISTKIDPRSANPGHDLSNALEASRNRINGLIQNSLSPEALQGGHRHSPKALSDRPSEWELEAIVSRARCFEAFRGATWRRHKIRDVPKRDHRENERQELSAAGDETHSGSNIGTIAFNEDLMSDCGSLL